MDFIMEEVPGQKFHRERLSQERTRSALHDILKLVPRAIRETMDREL